MISSVNFAYSISVHSSTGNSPFELIFEKNPALPPVLYQLLTEASTNNYTDCLSRLTEKIIKLQIEAFEKQYSAKISSKKLSEARKHITQFREGDLVLYHQTFGSFRKHILANLWRGPYKITKKVGPEAYIINNEEIRYVFNQIHAIFFKYFF